MQKQKRKIEVKVRSNAYLAKTGTKSFVSPKDYDRKDKTWKKEIDY